MGCRPPARRARGRQLLLPQRDDHRAWRKCAGCLIGYEIPDNPEPLPDDMPAMFVPLQELENLAPGTWYINVLAVRPQFRNQGLGTKLLWLKRRRRGSESEG